MNQDLELEKFEEYWNPKSKSNLTMLCLAILVMLKVVGFGWFFAGIVSYLVYKTKKKSIKENIEKSTPKTYKDFVKGRKKRKTKSPVEDKLKKTVLLTKQKKAELTRKRKILLSELNNLAVNTEQDKRYAEALRSGLDIVNKQIAKVEESYAHLELSVYNREFQELLKLTKNKDIRKNYNRIKKALARLITNLETDVLKYDNLRHPRAIDEYNALIGDITAYRDRIEQIRRKELLDDISMTSVYDEDRKNSASFDKMKDLYRDLEANKSIEIAMDELEALEEEMQRLNAESEVLKKYGDTL